jgi:hypothetical protein
MIIAMKKHAYVVGAIFVFALLVRGLVYYGYLQHDANYWQIDSLGYNSVAKGIAAGHGISTLDGAPNFHRVPGYPLYLALFKTWCGDSPAAALWTQVLLGAVIPVLIFLLALILFPGQAMLAAAAGLYAAVHLGLVLYSGFMMTETLFILFFLGFLLLFFSHCDNPKRIATAGVLLGIASLIRPVGHYLIVLALLILLLQKTYLPIRIRNCALLFLAWLVPVSIWLARNYLLLGHLFFHTLPGGHFLQLSASRVVMQAEHITYQKARERVSAEAYKVVRKQELSAQKRLSEIERCYVYEKLAIKHFAAHPLITLKLWATDIFRTTFSLYSAELVYLESGRKQIDYFAPGRTLWNMIERYLFPETNNVWLKLLVWLEILLYSFMLFGFARASWLLLICGNSHDRMLWLSIASFMALFLIISLAGGYARMRLPIEPFIIILGLYGYVAQHKKAVARS